LAGLDIGATFSACNFNGAVCGGGADNRPPSKESANNATYAGPPGGGGSGYGCWLGGMYLLYHSFCTI